MNRRFTARASACPSKHAARRPPTPASEQGLALQKSIFGEAIDRMYETSPADQIHIQRYLSGQLLRRLPDPPGTGRGNPGAADLRHAGFVGRLRASGQGTHFGQCRVGNGKPTLLAVVTQLLPYIGYPRSLNAIACLNEVLPRRNSHSSTQRRPGSSCGGFPARRHVCTDPGGASQIRRG